ncbi:hypothetical protein [Planktothrix agardhii]|jgi:hypothetical protein|uniref:Uncharacterized protein n=2 Tax=Planktothrix agardhii TaxID=1160 RepID=A0A1J1JHY1_PLAAG|nr:hypothetical protein [Planktothrix agardhii]MCF3608434.1 hypothetical protein [Planktothrix agardhii 1033]BBD54526.1 hypothetical protein NIES204_18200 [Planktothrix agardhii NIES-204]MBG0746534.1 hypothetical protein [Planktothrix agardhii KL2]MCB8752555.1 hypothetical protein [Planktothrix agardhii 1810]MCB8761584.1 hypothetical protein [Planktothrix agardhii 1813]
MNSHKVTLEISETLFEQLSLLADLKEESIEYLVVQIIAAKLPCLIQRESQLNQLLEAIKPDSIHTEIGLET